MKGTPFFTKLAFGYFFLAVISIFSGLFMGGYAMVYALFAFLPWMLIFNLGFVEDRGPVFFSIAAFLSALLNGAILYFIGVGAQWLLDRKKNSQRQTPQTPPQRPTQ